MLIAFSRSFQRIPSTATLLAFALQGAIFVGYGFSLLVRYRNATAPPIRHLLIWPALLIVGTNLYLGITIDARSDSYLLIYPLLVFLASFLVSEVLLASWLRLSLGGQFIANLSAVIIVLVLVVLSRIPVFAGFAAVGQHLNVLLFSIAIAAYLAVVESWQICANVVRTTTNDEERRTPFAALPYSCRANQYYIASLVAIIGATWLIVLSSAFLGIGPLFIPFFAAHSLVHMYWWRRRVNRPGQLLTRNWSLIKTVFAGAVLVMAALDRQLSTSINLVFGQAFNFAVVYTIVMGAGASGGDVPVTVEI